MDMENLMAQAAELQNKVSAAQEKLGSMRIGGIAENGACVVTLSGKYDMLGISIRPDMVSRGADGIARLVMTAYADAKAKADAIRDALKEEMLRLDTEELTAGAYILRYTSIVSNRFDSTTFKRLYADLYKDFTKPISSRRFTVSC